MGEDKGITKTPLGPQTEVPMAYYRLSELDLSTRIMLAREMPRPTPERKWGRATELAWSQERKEEWIRLYMYTSSRKRPN